MEKLNTVDTDDEWLTVIFVMLGIMTESDYILNARFMTHRKTPA